MKAGRSLGDNSISLPCNWRKTEVKSARKSLLWCNHTYTMPLTVPASADSAYFLHCCDHYCHTCKERVSYSQMISAGMLTDCTDLWTHHIITAGTQTVTPRLWDKHPLNNHETTDPHLLWSQGERCHLAASRSSVMSACTRHNSAFTPTQADSGHSQRTLHSATYTLMCKSDPWK